jgi:hypothetical protein
MISSPKIWPVAVAILGIFLFIAGQVYLSGYLAGMAFILFAFILNAMHNRHWERKKYRGQLIGYLVALAGLVLATLGYWQLALDPESSTVADQVFLNWVSPGQFILLPLGLILFGVYIQQAPELPIWGRPVTLVVGLVGFVGVLPTILNWFNYGDFLFLAELSGLVMLLGWILIGVVLWREAVTPAEG